MTRLDAGSTRPGGITPAPIFLVGCPRSGTTLLRDLLRSHPNLTFPYESHFIPRFYRAYGDPRNDDEARDLARRVLALSWITWWRLDLSPDAFADCRSFRAVVARLFGAWAEKHGKPRWGDKTPHYVRDIPTLVRLFPEAKIVHIYRDGRDVALSWLRAELEPGNLFMAATFWRSWVAAGREAGARLPPETYLEVRYEELVADPRTSLQRICRFIDEPFTDDVLAMDRLIRNGRISALAVSHSEIVAHNVNKWKTAMTSRDLDLFASVAGGLLADLGYEAAGQPRRISPIERAWWRAHHALWRGRHYVRRRFRARHLRTAWELARARLRPRT